MLPTYRAVLYGDHLEWEDDVPEQVRKQGKVTVFVTIVGESQGAEEERRRHMAAALERLAAEGGLAIVGDAAEWQRDQREDRLLPGQAK